MSPVGPATALDEKRRSLTNRNLDQRQREALPFICEWVKVPAGPARAGGGGGGGGGGARARARGRL